MTKFYAHRGNVFGPQPEFENTTNYIRFALFNGFHVEIDLRLYFMNGYNFYLSHKRVYSPKEFVSFGYLNSDRFLLHCKEDYLGSVYNYLCFNYKLENITADFFEQGEEKKVKTYFGKTIYHEENNDVWDENTILVWPGDFKSFSETNKIFNKSKWDKIKDGICPEPFGVVTDYPMDFRNNWSKLKGN